MADEAGDLDNVRYEHHLKHRGRHDRHLAQLCWLLICLFVIIQSTQRVFAWWGRRYHKHTARSQTVYPSVQLARVAAFFRAVFLLSLPLPFGLSPTSAGRSITLVAYVFTIAVLLVSVDAPKFSAHFVDDVAFRAAWVTVTQVPLVYFLSTKRGPINFLTGLSYERINWMHRWAGRMLFLSATVHMSIMMSSISLVELMESPDKAMSVVRYGAGAYGTLAWIALSSILPLRRWSYQIFYINHWICTLVFLGIVANHVPSYARLPIYTSLVLVVADKCLCAYRFVWCNMTIQPLKRKFTKFRRGPSRQVLAMGHPVKMMTPFITNGSVPSSESTTVIRICDVPFSWTPGQHVRLYIPQLGALEVHPFTPATCSDISSSPLPPSKDNDAEYNVLLPHHSTPTTNDIVLMIRAHSGLTKRLLDYHSKWLSLPCPNASQSSSSLTAYLEGPYGNPPAWEDYENIILIATSTGISFILSILDYLEQLCFEGQARLRTQQIRVLWANRHVEPHFEINIIDMLSQHSTMLRESGILIEAVFYVTCPKSEDQVQTLEMQAYDPFAHLRRPRPNFFASRPPLRIRHPDALDDEEYEEEEECFVKHVEPRISEAESHLSELSYGTYVSSPSSNDENSLSDIVSDVDSDDDSTLDGLETSCWDRTPSLRFPKMSKHVQEEEVCQCANIRHQQSKVRAKRSPNFISRVYGSRPDIHSTLSTSIPRASSAKTMVAVCSNRSLTAQARTTVARMNMDFAQGKRERGVEIHTEGFG